MKHRKLTRSEKRGPLITYMVMNAFTGRRLVMAGKPVPHVEGYTEKSAKHAARTKYGPDVYIEPAGA